MESGNPMLITTVPYSVGGEGKAPKAIFKLLYYVRFRRKDGTCNLCRNIFFVRPTFYHSLVFSCVCHSLTL